MINNEQVQNKNNKHGNYVMSCSEEDLVEWWY